MTENEKINGWTFEETIKIAENLMETESNMFKWDVLRHLRDFAENYKDELEQHRAIGTIDEFKALKEKNETLKALYESAIKEGNNLIIKTRTEAVNEFANYLHGKAKENNGLYLSSETRSWTHPCIFDYVEEFNNEKICKEET